MSRAVFISKHVVDESLQPLAAQGKRLLEPFRAFALANNLPINILEDKEVQNDAEVHTHEGDLWFCLEGEVAFICDGEMSDTWYKVNSDGVKDKREIKAKTITGGVEYILRAGDWLWIPAGVPHQHNASGTARLMIIKIPSGAQK